MFWYKFVTLFALFLTTPIMITVGELVKDVTPFSVKAYFGNCPTSAPTFSAAPSTSMVPTAKPSEEQIQRIVPMSCEGNNKFEFRLNMSPGDNPRNNLVVKVLRRGDDGSFKNRTLKKVFRDTRADQVEQKCLWKRLCMKALVLSKSGEENLNKSSFSAYWNG